MDWNLNLYLPVGVPVAVVLLLLLIIFMITDSGPSGEIDLTDPDTHVIITGGSSGIGLATAIKMREKGCSVTIIARNLKKLNEAEEEIRNKTPLRNLNRGSVNIVSADVGNAEEIKKAIQSSCEKCGNRVDVLITSAGSSRPGYVQDVDINMYEQMVRINYLGCVYASLAVIPLMKKAGRGRIVYVSSLAGLVSMIGLAGYSASKFAVRGFAESLQMELKPHNVFVSLVNPPDVDTPMLREEMQWKPQETKLLSEDGGLFQAEDIATDILAAIKSWRFMVNTGLDGWLLGLASPTLSTPCPSLGRALAEISLGSIMRVVSLSYLTKWNAVCKAECEKKKKQLATAASS